MNSRGAIENNEAVARNALNAEIGETFSAEASMTAGQREDRLLNWAEYSVGHHLELEPIYFPYVGERELVRIARENNRWVREAELQFDENVLNNANELLADFDPFVRVPSPTVFIRPSEGQIAPALNGRDRQVGMPFQGRPILPAYRVPGFISQIQMGLPMNAWRVQYAPRRTHTVGNQRVLPQRFRSAGNNRKFPPIP